MDKPIQEIMIESKANYSDLLELKKLELKEIKESTKKVDRAKKLVEKLGVNFVQVGEVEIDEEQVKKLETEISILKSLIRRYNTVLEMYQ